MASACGLDVGTSNLLVARLVDDDVEVHRLRNAFVEIDDEQKARLAAGALNAVHLKGHSYIVGDEALSIARVLSKDLRRPMASGVLNPDEKEGRAIVSTLIKTLLGDPVEDGERCAFSIPAVPIDNPKANNVWHTGFFSSLLESFGYTPEPVNEALAIIYSDCGQDDHCGIAISHGAGQVNVAASYKLIASLEFSIARSGDWIDQNSATATGTTTAKVLRVKEDPNFSLLDTSTALDEEIGEALKFHYIAMIKYELTHLVREWMKMKHQMDFPDAVPIILSGGTASLKGFKELWIEELEKFQKKNPLPFKVKEVRMANDPFGAVARGLLTYALATQKG